MMKVTLDTNVLISGTFWEGEAYKIIQLIEQGKVKSIISKEILIEYNRVLHSDEIVKKTEEKELSAKTVTIKVIETSTIVNPRKKLQIVLENPDDNKIIECALEGQADFIITYDPHLLKIKKFHDIIILTPKEFLQNFE